MNDYILIQLTQDQKAYVDLEDAFRVLKFKWYAAQTASSFRACRRCGTKMLGMSRFILNAEQEEIVDHKNHDTLDNRRKNLRLCTVAENTHNSRKFSNNTTGYKGVCWHKRRNKYIATIAISRKNIHLGYFKTAKEAALAYNKAAKEIFGEFACINECV